MSRNAQQKGINRDVLVSMSFGCFSPNRFSRPYFYEKSNQGAQEFAHKSAKRAHPWGGGGQGCHGRNMKAEGVHIDFMFLAPPPRLAAGSAAMRKIEIPQRALVPFTV